MGRKKKAHYRIVVADNDSPRDGRFIESIGYYKPLSNPARLVLNLERVDHWLSEGAQPSGTMKSLIAKARKGGDSLVALGEADPEEQKAKRAEVLAARRATEEQAAQKAAAARAAEEPAEEEAAEEPAEEEAAEEPAEEEAAEEPAEEEAAEEPAEEEAAEEPAEEEAAEEPAEEEAAEEPAEEEAVEEPAEEEEESE